MLVKGMANMKKEIQVFDYAKQICQSLPSGVLLTTKQAGKVNTMTIGWGTLGIEWGKPVFIAYVRKSRYTKQLLDESGEFTVNIPYGTVDKRILGFCGTKSGRDVDKVAALGLELEEPVRISVPGIKQLPLTLECRVLYRQQQDMKAIPADIVNRYYPADDTGEQDVHTAYYGEILDAYVIDDGINV